MSDERQEERGESAVPQRTGSGRMPENLKPYAFKPGQSGNPEGGRLVKTTRFRRYLHEALDEFAGNKRGKPVPADQAIAHLLVRIILAPEKDERQWFGLAVKEVLARVDPVASKVDVATPDGPIRLAHGRDWDAMSPEQREVAIHEVRARMEKVIEAMRGKT